MDGSLVVHQYTNRRHQQIAGGNEKCSRGNTHYKTMGFTHTQQSAAFFVKLINLRYRCGRSLMGKTGEYWQKTIKDNSVQFLAMKTCSLSIIESESIGEKSMRCRQIVTKNHFLHRCNNKSATFYVS